MPLLAVLWPVLARGGVAVIVFGCGGVAEDGKRGWCCGRLEGGRLPGMWRLVVAVEGRRGWWIDVEGIEVLVADVGDGVLGGSMGSANRRSQHLPLPLVKELGEQKGSQSHNQNHDR